MTIYTEPKYLSDVLIVEVAPNWTKQNGLLAATTIALVIGTVLSKDASGIYQPIDFAATDGTEDAVAVLATHADINTSQQKIVLIARGATVAKNELVFPEGATEPQIAAALAQLEALGIVAQDTY